MVYVKQLASDSNTHRMKYLFTENTLTHKCKCFLEQKEKEKRESGRVKKTDPNLC